MIVIHFVELVALKISCWNQNTPNNRLSVSIVYGASVASCSIVSLFGKSSAFSFSKASDFSREFLSDRTGRFRKLIVDIAKAPVSSSNYVYTIPFGISLLLISLTCNLIVIIDMIDIGSAS